MERHTSVLLVDDDVTIVWAVGRCLTRAGFAVMTCGDGLEAVSLLSTRPCDVLVTDIQMPGLNGLQLIDWVRENRPETRVVVITAFGSPALREASSKKGAFLYFEKPVDPDLLIEALRSPDGGEHFHGTVSEIDLVDYLQLLLLGRRPALVEVRSLRGERGLIHINQGDFLHAECDGVPDGNEAIFRILEFRGGSFSSLPWRDPEKATTQGRASWLLLEAARRRDEALHSDIERSIPTEAGPFYKLGGGDR